MNDELKLLEIDSRVRAALQGNDDVCRRVVARALADHHGSSTRRSSRIRFALATSIVLAILLALAGFQWRHRAVRSTTQSLSVTSAGSVLVVESQDGRRWIVGRSLPRRSGNYVMVVSE